MTKVSNAHAKLTRPSRAGEGACRVRPFAALFCLALTASTACEETPVTQVVMAVDSNMPELSRVELQVLNEDGREVSSERSLEIVPRDPGPGQVVLPLSVAVTRGTEDSFVFVASGHDGLGVLRVTQKVRVPFVPRETLLVQVQLDAQCDGVLDCRADQTCYLQPAKTDAGQSIEAGTCGPVPQVEGAVVNPGEVSDALPAKSRYRDAGPAMAAGANDDGGMHAAVDAAADAGEDAGTHPAPMHADPGMLACDGAPLDDGGSCSVADGCSATSCPGHSLCQKVDDALQCVCAGPWMGADCDQPLVWAAPARLTIDAANDRAFVIDASVDAVFSVALATGNRALVSGLERGDGPKLRQPADVVYAPESGRLYVLSSADDVVFEMDPASGDRQVLTDPQGLFSAGKALGTGPAFGFPSSMALDAAHGRLLIVDRGLGAVVAVDLGSGDRAIFSDASDDQNAGKQVGAGPGFKDPSAIVVDVQSDRAFVTDAERHAVIAVDLSTGEREIFSDDSDEAHGGQTVGQGPGLVAPLAIALDAALGRLLVADAFSNFQALFAVDLSTRRRRVLSDASGRSNGGRIVGAGPHTVSMSGLAFDAARDRALIGDTARDAVFAVQLSDGARSLLSDPAVGLGPTVGSPADMTFDPTSRRIWMTDGSFQSIVEINADTAERKVVSDSGNIFADGEQVGSGPQFVWIAGIAADLASNRLFVTDWGEDALFSVNLSNGQRTILSDAAQLLGTGPALGVPGSIGLDLTAGRALVLDDELGALVSIHLNSGDRTVLSSAAASVGAGPAFSLLRGLLLDLAQDRAFVGDAGLHSILEVNLSTGARSVLSDDFDEDNGGALVGSGPALDNPGGMVRDGERLLVVDTWRRALFSVSLADGKRVILSDLNHGSGPDLLSPVCLVLDREHQRVLVGDSDYNAVLSVDLTTGDRAFFAK